MCDVFIYLSARNGGYVSAAYFLGAFISSNLWGGLSDYVGRKPVTIFCTAMSAGCAIAFGTAQNITWALIARLATGKSVCL